MRIGNLLNELPYWEVIDGTMLNANGIAEIGVRLQMKPSLTQKPEQLELPNNANAGWWLCKARYASSLA